MKYYLMDYHTHSRISPDGSQPCYNMAAAAVDRSLREIAVTDHCECGEGFPAARAMEDYQSACKRLEGKIKIRFGLELGQPHHNFIWAEETVYRAPFDFIIGSIHNLKGEKDFYEIKYESEEHCHDLLGRYFDEMLSLSAWGGFDVLGHITYPLRYMIGREGFRLDLSRYYPILRRIFEQIVGNKKGIELNVSGLNTKWETAMPSEDILTLYRECGGTIITVGSDAHSPGAVGIGIKEGYKLLKNHGFTCVTAFEKRSPTFHLLTKKGNEYENSYRL